MARIQECDHTEAYIICPVCDDEEGEAREPRSKRRATTAEFEGDCELCPHRIEIGDEIALIERGRHGRQLWVHEECAQEAAAA